MKDFKMRWVIWIICFVCPLSVLSADRLSLQECADLVKQGKGETAIDSLQQLFFEQKESTEWNEDEFAMTFVLLYNVYSTQGMPREMFDLCIEALKIFNQQSPNPNTEVSRQLWRFAGAVKMELKDYDSAIYYLRQAQNMYEDESIYDNGYFSILTLLGGSYLQKNDFVSAKLYLDEAEEIHVKYLGEITQSQFFDSYQLLTFKGLLLQYLGDDSEAEKCFKSVIESDPGNLLLEGIKDIAKNNLAISYTLAGKYSDAMTLYNSINLTSPGMKYLNYQNIAMSALMNNDIDSAIEYLGLSNDIAFDYLESIVFDFAEVERENYWSEVSSQLIKNNNFFASWTNHDTALRMGFEMNSFVRDFNFNFQKLIKQLYLSKNSSAHSKKWHQYQTNRGLLSYGFESVVRHDSIALEVINSEREILSTINFNLRDIYRKNYNIKNIQSKLCPNDVIIDYIYSSVQKGDSIIDGFEEGYSVYSLNAVSKYPKLTPLCKQREIKSLIYRPNADADFINNIYTEKKDSLYKLLIEPLLPIIEGKERLYIRLIGLLSSVNIEAIVMPDGKRFGDKYDVRIVSEFTNINSKDPDRYSNIALFGDPDFFSNRNNHSHEMALEIPASIEYDIITRGVRGNWGTLPGTRTEIGAISKIADTHKISSTSYIGKNASETMVKLYSGNSPSILHFATHGYFIATKDEKDHNNFLNHSKGYSWNNHLMLYSGLLFAGANEVWNGKATPNPIDDGILSADEISRLDFSDTDLVVLSACDTGKGHQGGMDGSMGLQRAFRAAGAKTMVMSLWQVSDEATTLLMQLFYKYLFSSHSVRESLKLAQKDLINRGYSDPYYWAAFVVLD